MTTSNPDRMTLDHNSVIPLYYQLKNLIREEVASQNWAANEMIPSEHELSQQYGVSRATVRRALGDLVTEGVLYRRQGLGTFVAPPKIQDDLLGFYSLSASLRRQGYETESRVLAAESITATPGLRRTFDLDPDAQINRIVRLREVQGQPLLLETTYIPERYTPGLIEHKLDSSPVFFQLLTEHYKLNLDRAKKTLEPRLADEYEAKLLGIKEGAPVLVIERHTYSPDGHLVALSNWVVRGDRCKHYIDPENP